MVSAAMQCTPHKKISESLRHAIVKAHYPAQPLGIWSAHDCMRGATAAAGPGLKIGPCCNVQNFDRFFEGLAAFTAVAFPAAMVNSGLKYMQKQIQLAFMRRLTHHLHERYCANRAYYAASVLGGDPNVELFF